MPRWGSEGDTLLEHPHRHVAQAPHRGGASHGIHATGNVRAQGSVSSPTRASAASPGAPWPADWSPAPGANAPHRARNSTARSTSRTARSSSTATGPSSRPSSASPRRVSMAQIAMAWVLKNPVVSAPIVGATKPHHLADAAAALDIELTAEEIDSIEEPYVTRRPTFF
ncbi:aldo/keto reductase [Streptomyces sp. NBC_01518]|uniref:aldo/keto reductase n=1 Tax=Streptomyces sp. NBC_01518 TaxID=2903891 RepID=UPI00386F9CCC